MFFDEDDELFGGSVETKFFDVVFHASPTLVKREITGMLEKIAKYEILLEQNKIDTKQYVELDEGTIEDYYIQSMGNILSNHE